MYVCVCVCVCVYVVCVCMYVCTYSFSFYLKHLIDECLTEYKKMIFLGLHCGCSVIGLTGINVIFIHVSSN